MNKQIIESGMGGSGIVFYNKMNICSGQSLRSTPGQYLGENNPVLELVKRLKPIVVKIEPKTTVEIMTKTDKYIYNNPYSDRFVVVKLSLSDKPIEITGYTVGGFIDTVTMIDKNGIYLSFIDLLTIILILLMIWLCYKN